MPSWNRARNRRCNALSKSASVIRFCVPHRTSAGNAWPSPKAALQIGPGFQRGGGGVGHVRRIMVAGIHVGDRGTIADHIAIEVPVIAQMIAQQHGVGAGGRAVDRRCTRTSPTARALR